MFTLASKTTVLWQPDLSAAGRMTSLVNPDGERTSYAYDSAGRRTVKRLANDTRTSFVYDAAGQNTQIDHLKSDNSSISDFAYTYDAAGRRLTQVESDGSRVLPASVQNLFCVGLEVDGSRRVVRRRTGGRRASGGSSRAGNAPGLRRLRRGG